MSLGRLRVRAEAELRTARRHERRRELATGDGAHEVGVRTRLDLDHLGAVLGEAAADFHPDRADAEVHDPHAGERRRRFRRGSDVGRDACVAQVGEDLLGVLADRGRRCVRTGTLAVELVEAGEHGRGDAVADVERRERAA